MFQNKTRGKNKKKTKQPRKKNKENDQIRKFLYTLKKQIDDMDRALETKADPRMKSYNSTRSVDGKFSRDDRNNHLGRLLGGK